MIKKIITLVMALAMVMSVAACTTTNSTNGDYTNTSGGKNEANFGTITEKPEDTSKEEIEVTGNYVAEIDIENYGVIKLELYGDKAPITVANFVKLANEGFYNGLTFHRIMEGFMMQGGDPLGNGFGGSDENIKGEFKANNVENDISHVRGVISMARGEDMDSASSQFFIVHEDSTFLDGMYAAFGRVIDGMEVVDKVCEESQPIDNNGTIMPIAQPKITKITVTEVKSETNN